MTVISLAKLAATLHRVRHGCLRLVVVSVGVCGLSAPAAAANTLHAPRRGLTTSVGLGLGTLRFETAGLAMPSVFIGAYMRRDLALGLYLTGTTHAPAVLGRGEYLMAHVLLGTHARLNLGPRLYTAVTCGLSTYSQYVSLPRQGYGKTLLGFGAGLKMGWQLAQEGQHGLHVAAEIIPTYLATQRLTSIFPVSATLLAEWHYN